MLPWTHVHFWPDASAHYCCISDSSKPVGKYTGDLGDIINSEHIKRVRRNMLNDQPSPECGRCYELEKNGIQSLRQSFSYKYRRYFEDVEKTNSDGSVQRFTMRYLDIRFSNLCNFRCRSCGPSLSSSWFEDQVNIYGAEGWPYPKVIGIEPKEKFWQDLLPSLAHVENAYFAGGEPLITDEVYRVLDHWISIGNMNVEIDFTTNFSRLNFKNKNIIDYWKKFPRTTVSASLDDSGPRAEYMRKGTNWNQIVENRRRMLRECPEVAFEITPTISLFNIWHFPEFHLEWLEEGLLTTDGIRMNIMTAPASQSINVIPHERRRVLIARWEEYLDRIIRRFDLNPVNYNKTINGYQSVIQALKTNEYYNLKNEFYERNRLVDAARNEDLHTVFPEIEALLAD